MIRVRFSPVVAVASAVTLLLVAVVVIAIEPLHGSVLLTVMPGHGIDTGDLVVLPVVLLAVWLLRASLRGEPTSRERSIGPDMSVLCLGATLSTIGSLRLADVTQRTSLGAAMLGLLLLSTVVWFLAELVFSVAPSLVVVGSWGWLLGLVLLIGSLIDVAFTPSGTVFGVAAFALGLALVVSSRRLVLTLLVLVVVLVLLNLASLADVADVDVVMSGDGGGAARAAALGVVLMVLAIASLVTDARNG